jgi:LacI family transcriptional regulator
MLVRLKDIADDLNLSKMTISKVLRGQTDISDATKARVLKRVKELKYIPNISASSLRTGQTKTMGLILPSMGKSYLGDVAAGINRTVSPAGYSLIVCSSQNDVEIEQRQIEVFLSLQVDALLIISTQETTTFFEQLQKPKKMPLIFVDHKPSGTTQNFVGVREEDVGRIACEHLISCGCRRIAYIRGPRTAMGDLRSKGYRQAMSDHGLTAQPDLMIDNMGSGESEYKCGSDAMVRLLARRGRPEGVMTYTDVMAIGAMDAARSHGVKIPEEMRFIGCGNDSLLCEIGVSLSSIDIRGQELGQRAGRLALRSIAAGHKAGIHKVIVAPKLVKRESSAR